MKTLFLDRDGVINKEKKDSYIFNKEEFLFYEGALEAIARLSKRFDYIIIVTNQRGIGRNLMTEQQLQGIHDYLRTEVKKVGGRIDGIYFAPYIDSNHPHRKPNTGMALAAKNDFPRINFKESVMVGNNLSDMQFGKNLGMKTIFLYTTQKAIQLPNALVDKQFSSLEDYAALDFET